VLFSACSHARSISWDGSEAATPAATPGPTPGGRRRGGAPAAAAAAAAAARAASDTAAEARRVKWDYVRFKEVMLTVRARAVGVALASCASHMLITLLLGSFHLSPFL
jgi:hypothetical protein